MLQDLHLLRKLIEDLLGLVRKGGFRAELQATLRGMLESLLEKECIGACLKICSEVRFTSLYPMARHRISSQSNLDNIFTDDTDISSPGNWYGLSCLTEIWSWIKQIMKVDDESIVEQSWKLSNICWCPNSRSRFRSGDSPLKLPQERPSGRPRNNISTREDETINLW